jgi:dihydropteroate synthase
MKKTINIDGKIVSLAKPLIMGIMNITPDSFYKDSRFNPFEENFYQKADKLLNEGADILDIGGYSTRPGADHPSAQEEIDRVCPAIELIRKKNLNIPISIDTFRAKVAEAALSSGANLINDVSAGNLDPDMLALVVRKNCPYILMHMRGTPKNMNLQTNYKHLLKEIIQETFEKVNYLKQNGVKDIIVDPGFGFAKTMEQNYDLLKNINSIYHFQTPLLMGISRKSMIYKYLEIHPEEALSATSQLHLFGLLNGVNILRVHDPKEAKQSIKLYEKLK